MQQALEIQKAELGEEHPIVASSYNNVGAIQYQVGDFQEALRCYQKALAIHQ
jgi:tetratricopeptide (TPR) repeat protein